MADVLHQLFGTDQGSGGSPHFWIAMLEVIISCIDSELEGFTCANPMVTVVKWQNKYTFVDNSGLAVGDQGGDVVATL